jgi:DNA topoisomerase-2
MVKDISQKYKKLDEVQHVLLRPGRYIGSIKPLDTFDFVYDAELKKMVKREVTYNPGFLKLFDEIISNSADFSKTPDGKHVDVIRVDIDQGKGIISVFDNGGIPIVEHPEHKQYVPEMIFELRAGSNFDDDDESVLTGQNGEGAGLTNIFSKKFIVETCDATAARELKKKPEVFKMVFEENSQVRNKPDIKPAGKEKGFTRITYHPDFEKLGMSGIDDDNYAMLYNRTIQIACTNTHLKVYFNGERLFPVPNHSFKDFIELFGPYDEEFEYAYDDTQHFKVGVSASTDGEFEHVTFVNSTHTKIGGTHINYVGMQIWNAVREHIQKKHKVDVPPAQLRQHMRLYIDATIVNPRYSSQTKEDLITEVKDYKTSYTPSDKFIRRILNSGIIQDILDAAEAKAEMEKRKAMRDKMKDIDKADYRRVEKFTDANEKRERSKCVLFLSEGDSASKAVQGGRGGNSAYLGSFPLKGKPLNVRDKEIERVLGIKKKNKKDDDNKKKEKPSVIQNIMTIMGLRIGEKVDNVNQLNFGRVAFTTDADVDGAHISGLLINFFDRFWPELFDMGVICIFRTPLVKVFVKNKLHAQFFTEREFHDWEKKEGQKVRGWTHKYYKGLGTSSTKEFMGYMQNMDEYLFQIDMKTQEDKDAIDLAFNGQRADDRKEWLETPAANFEDFVIEAERLVKG